MVYLITDMASGQGIHWPVENLTVFDLSGAILKYVYSFFYILKLLTYTISKKFYCPITYFLKPNLHCSPLGLGLKKIVLSNKYLYNHLYYTVFTTIQFLPLSLCSLISLPVSHGADIW